ncbi:MAG: hypothetical protein CMP14_10425 [Rickettsiales bacterium]|nr:hypothetical protein [Rickettsiales bacterium]
MTDIATIGAANNGQRASFESQEQQFTKQQNQTKIEQFDFADRQLEQTKLSANDAHEKNLNLASDNIQNAQSTAGSQLESSRQEEIEQEEQVVKVSLSDAAQQTQNQENQITPKDVNSAEQNNTERTKFGFGADDFTRLNNDNQKREDTSNVESRQTRELGRVLDTFA